MTTIKELFSELPYKLDRTVFGVEIPRSALPYPDHIKAILQQFQWRVCDEPTSACVGVYTDSHERLPESDVEECFKMVALEEPLKIKLPYVDYSYSETTGNYRDSDRYTTISIQGTVYDILMMIYKKYRELGTRDMGDHVFFEGIGPAGYIYFGS